MPEFVLPSDLDSTPDLPEALDIVRRNQPRPFGIASTSYELLHLLEWFVDPPCQLELLPALGGKLRCYCLRDALHFVGRVIDPTIPKRVGFLGYDVDLTPGAECVHLDWYEKREFPAQPSRSMTPHLRRAYKAMVRAGIPKLKLEAGLTSGPTFWAYAGVEFQAGRPLLDHLELLATDLAGADAPSVFNSPNDVRLAFPQVTVTIREAYERSAEISHDASGKAWVTPGQLAHKQNELGIAIDDPLPLGEALLFAIGPWNGEVDLSSPGVSDVPFRTFLGL